MKDLRKKKERNASRIHIKKEYRYVTKWTAKIKNNEVFMRIRKKLCI